MSILIAAMLLGTVVRLHNIADRSMGHIEMFVPGIPLPPDLSVPKPRMDLWTTVTSTLNSDTHPPGFYVMMFFVTKLFGSSTIALRLPSVLFGVASIGLLYWLGVLVGPRMPAAVAAAFLAFNGYHIVWSETARMYTLLCFLGLLTTIFMLLIVRSTGRRRAMEFGYAALTLMGLCTQVFYWPMLATQMAWVMGNAWARKCPMPRLLRIQILVVILGSPLLAFAAYQSGNQVAFLSRDVPMMARQFVQFAYLIPGWDDTYSADGSPAMALAPQFTLPLLLLLLLCVTLLAIGLRQLKPSPEEAFNSDPAGSFTLAWMIAAVLGALAIVAHVVIATHHTEAKPTLRLTEALIPLPILLAFAGVILQRSWDRLRNMCSPWSFKFLQGAPPLVWMMAAVPFLLLGAVSLLYRPLMDSRGLLFLAPYLLLILATGAVTLGRRSRWLAVFLVLILGTLHGISVWAYRDRLTTPVDFKVFADKLEPHIQPTDLIFLKKDWSTTPILYYMTPDHYHLYASNFSEVSQRNPNARVWVLTFRGDEDPVAIKQAVEGYRETETVATNMARGVLYIHSPGG
jgi:4-amino-4-deoxy-L-arabinose transferase-like glycosyltransferase